MAITLKEFFNLGVGDKVKFSSVENIRSFDGYVPSMDSYAGKVYTIEDVDRRSFYIKESSYYFGVECIEEIVEKNAEYRPFSQYMLDYMDKGDKILLKTPNYINNSWLGGSSQSVYGDCVVTFKCKVDDTHFNIVEDKGKYCWHYDLVYQKIFNYKEPTEEEIQEILKIENYVHEISFRPSLLECAERTDQLELVKITTDVDKIIRNYYLLFRINNV